MPRRNGSKRARKRETIPPEHVTRGSVFDDLGFSPEKAELLKLKAELHAQIVEYVKRAKKSQEQLREILRTSQPRISDLMTGKLGKFSLDMLVSYAAQLGLHPEIRTSPSAAAH